VNILLVDDNPGDLELFTEALQEIRASFQLDIARDGQAALARLLGSDRDENWPDLILLDLHLNLPNLNGHEILRRLKSDARTRRLPVIVMSSSAAPTDVARAYDAYANGYLCKPLHLDDLFRIVRAIRGFWLETAELSTQPLRMLDRNVRSNPRALSANRMASITRIASE
jgi:chemotaxis family two-component system response regulator Rcp1